MMADERMRTFLRSLESDDPKWLEGQRQKAEADRVPVIRRETGSLLRFLLKLKCPESILEVGTAVGYSALLMSEYMPQGCRIITIEKDEKRILTARGNFEKAGRGDRITLLAGDAGEVLGRLEPSFDFVFMDAAKGQYIRFLPGVMRLLAPGALLISDNVLQEGEILESRYAVKRRNRTIHARMREYLYELTHHPALETIVLPIGDGVTVSIRKD